MSKNTENQDRKIICLLLIKKITTVELHISTQKYCKLTGIFDTGAVNNVASQHHFAQDAYEASEFCLKAGCDWNCGMNRFNLE